jgi:hypothetical protein
LIDHHDGCASPSDVNSSGAETKADPAQKSAVLTVPGVLAARANAVQADHERHDPAGLDIGEQATERHQQRGDIAVAASERHDFARAPGGRLRKQLHLSTTGLRR